MPCLILPDCFLSLLAESRGNLAKSIRRIESEGRLLRGLWAYLNATAALLEAADIKEIGADHFRAACKFLDLVGEYHLCSRRNLG